MDKNTITGFVLIALVLIGFSWYSQPSADEIAQMQETARQDSILQAQQAEAVKKAEEQKALELQEKLRKNKFTLTDYLDQMSQLKNMGSLTELAGMIPGVKASDLEGAKVDEKAIAHMEAIILSMTPYEREHPECINGSRRKRIADGSGTSIPEVNKLLKQFEGTRKMMKTVMGANMGNMMRGMGGMRRR